MNAVVGTMDTSVDRFPRACLMQYVLFGLAFMCIGTGCSVVGHDEGPASQQVERGKADDSIIRRMEQECRPALPKGIANQFHIFGWGGDAGSDGSMRPFLVRVVGVPDGAAEKATVVALERVASKYGLARCEVLFYEWTEASTNREHLVSAQPGNGAGVHGLSPTSLRRVHEIYGTAPDATAPPRP